MSTIRHTHFADPCWRSAHKSAPFCTIGRALMPQGASRNPAAAQNPLGVARRSMLVILAAGYESHPDYR